MISRRLRKEISDLPKSKKCVGIGSLLLILSVFLPWYSEADIYSSQVLRGITGPLYFIGTTILLLSTAVFLMIAFTVTRKRLFHFPVDEWLVYLSSGILSLYFLVLVNTIYFHEDFGVNLAAKDIGFGMFPSFLGTVFLIIGGILEKQSKEPSARAFSEKASEEHLRNGKMTPLIDVSRTQRMMQGNIRETLKREQTVEDKEKEYQQNLRIDL